MNKLVILFLVFAVLSSIEAYRKVPIESIRSIHLYKGRYTTGNNPVLQQKCVGEYHLCAYYAPDYVSCRNSGSSRGQAIWRCEARLANAVRFGDLDVSCETYPGTQPYQGYVIDGSCGLTYTLQRG